MSLVNIEGYSSLKKDTTTGGVVNVDTNAYKRYMVKKAAALKNIQQQKSTQESVDRLQEQINNIEGDLQDIRTMLLQLIQKGN